MNCQNATQIVVASILGINLGIAGLPKRVSASPIFEASTSKIVGSDVSQSEQETVELETVEQNIIGQDTEQKEIEAQDTKKQDIEEQKEAAIAEIIEAIAADSAQPTDTDSADSAQPSTQLPTQLLDQLLANALNANHAPPRPGAEALGEPVSISLETATSTELPATIDLAAISQSFGPSFNIDPDTVPALRNALNSHNELTQLYAADTLWTLTGDANLILPTLISATESNQSETRELALLAIAQLGQEALPAVPILNDIITSDRDRSDDRTRQLAQDALEVVSSENRPATVLGILAREVQKLGGIPALFRAISRLW